MKRDLNQPMLDLDGKPFPDGATLKLMCFGALASTTQGDEQQPLELKLRRYELLQRVNVGGVVELTAEDIAQIKERANKAGYPVIALGAMCNMLEKEPT